ADVLVCAARRQQRLANSLERHGADLAGGLGRNHARRRAGRRGNTPATGALCNGRHSLLHCRRGQSKRFRLGGTLFRTRNEGAAVMDAELVQHTVINLLQGFGLSVYIGLTAIFLASLIGLGLALMRVSSSAAAVRFSFTYSTCFRGTPLLVQL